MEGNQNSTPHMGKSLLLMNLFSGRSFISA
jgi:hypothetical protein